MTRVIPLAWQRMAPVIVLCLLAVALGQTTRDGQQPQADSVVELIQNGDFEASFSEQGVAEKWTDNSDWAEVQVQYTRETRELSRGKHTQKIHCTSFKGGAVQLAQFGVPVVKGGEYRVSLWMRGELGSPVEVQLRKGPSPYTTYAGQVFQVGPQWACYSFEAMSWEDDPQAMFIIRLGSTGTLWLDDVSCRQVGRGDGTLRLTPPAVAIPREYFGVHLHRNQPQTPWPAAPFGALRLWDARVSWPQIQPQAGTWDFARLDSYLGLAQAHGADVLLPLGLTPTWASSRPEEKSAYDDKKALQGRGWAAEPTRLEDWELYVRTLAEHCRGRVHEYEIWNEPNATGFYSGTVGQLVELARRATRIIKEVDPANKVVTPSIVGDMRYLDHFLRLGGADHADIIGFHFYVWPEPPEKMVPQIQRVKQIMAAHGLGERPLWNTEAGWNIESLTSPLPIEAYEGRPPLALKDAGDYIVRAYVLNWAAGVQRYYFYAWDNGLMGLVEKDGSLKVPARMYARGQAWLVGAQMLSCEMDAEGTWTARLKRKGNAHGVIVWNANKTLEYRPPPAWRIVRVEDLSGEVRALKAGDAVKVNASPLLLESSPNQSD